MLQDGAKTTGTAELKLKLGRERGKPLADVADIAEVADVIGVADGTEIANLADVDHVAALSN